MSTMAGCPHFDDLSRAHSEGPSPEILSHVDRCATCSRVWQSLVELGRAARGLSYEPPTADSVQRMRGAVLERSVGSGVRRVRPLPSRGARIGFALGFAAAAAAAAAGTWIAVSGRSREQAAPAPQVEPPALVPSVSPPEPRPAVSPPQTVEEPAAEPSRRQDGEPKAAPSSKNSALRPEPVQAPVESAPEEPASVVETPAPTPTEPLAPVEAPRSSAPQQPVGPGPAASSDPAPAASDPGRRDLREERRQDQRENRRERGTERREERRERRQERREK